MKMMMILLAVAFLSAPPLAMAVENPPENAVSEAKKKKPKEEKPKPPPCACICPGTLPGTKWDCSPTTCSAKHGTSCAAGGPSQSPIGSATEN